jgi:Zn finger protein HypA/HybF involved in hydrogenase expression
MHEMSLAEALFTQVSRRVPAAATLRSVHIQAGPALAIEPMAMSMAWQAVTAESPLSDSALELDVLPWRMACGQCAREWTSDDPLDLCACGSAATIPQGHSHLSLLSLDIQTPAPAALEVAS